MKALTVEPLKKDSARLDEFPEPPASEGSVLCELAGVGVCGTDREIMDGKYGEAPPGQARLAIGHESVGRVLEAPKDSGFAKSDWVVGIVRRPDPEPCEPCSVGEWDMCRNGKYTERGIKGRHGFARERWRSEPEFLVPVPGRLAERAVLVETASIAAKAWDQIDVIARRGAFRPKRALITGAGPVGLMAALFAVQRGLETYVLDRTQTGPKPELVKRLGARYVSGKVRDACPRPGVIVECTGAGELVFASIEKAGPDGIVCLTGLAARNRPIPVDADKLAAGMVLENVVVFGSVNANRRHYALAVSALLAADPSWLDGILTRKVALSRFSDALEWRPDDVKTVLIPG